MDYLLLGIVLLHLLIVAVVGSLVRLWRIAAIGAAYKAKILCSIIFVSGRNVDLKHADEISAESYWPMRFVAARIDRAARSVTASVPGLRKRTAIYRPGLGATLIPLRQRLDTNPSPRASANSSRAWLRGSASAQLHRVVESAFAELEPKRLRRTRAIVVVQKGRIISERYAPGIAAETPLPGWSMAKSVLGALIGTLVGEGRLSLLDKGLLAEWRTPDPRAEISLDDLLRMRSGLKFSEVYSDLSSDVVNMLFNSDDSAAYAARQALISQPGKVWSYSSGTTNIVSKIARGAVGESEYSAWPRRSLFDPIGMTSAVLEADASGTFICSSFMLATAQDWARFGQLHLQDGVWDGRRVLPEGWVRYCTTPTRESAGAFGAHWWLKLQPELGGETPAAAKIPLDAFFALGHEGQTLTVIPSLDLVVVRLGLSIHIDTWNHAAFLAQLMDTL